MSVEGQQLFLIIIFLFSALLFGRMLKIGVNYFVLIYKQNKKYKQLRKKKDEMQANREPHQWTELEVGGKRTHVCRKSGYCPELDGFFTQEQIQYMEKMEQYKKDLEETLKQVYENVGARYGITADTAKSICENVAAEYSTATQAYLAMAAAEELPNNPQKG